MKNLDINKVISLGEKLLEIDLPEPPSSDFMFITSARLYLCAGGVTIGTKYYPPGASFEANITFMGHNAAASMSITSSKVYSFFFLFPQQKVIVLLDKCTRKDR